MSDQSATPNNATSSAPEISQTEEKYYKVYLLVIQWTAITTVAMASVICGTPVVHAATKMPNGFIIAGGYTVLVLLFVASAIALVSSAIDLIGVIIKKSIAEMQP